MNIEDADEVRGLIDHMRRMDKARSEVEEIRYLVFATGSDQEDGSIVHGAMRQIELKAFLNEGSSVFVEAATALRKAVIEGIDERHEKVVARLKELGVIF